MRPFLWLLTRAISRRPLSYGDPTRLSHGLRRFDRSHVHQRGRFIRFNSSSPRPQAAENATLPEPSPSLAQRLRKLSREYGWSALGVYLALSAVDFPFSFLAVRTLGTDRIGHWEHTAVEWFWSVVPWPFPPAVPEEPSGDQTGDRQKGGDVGSSIEEAEKNNQAADASIWTQLALAYAIHKSFIFVRVPLTAAITPRVVKVLRGWGWDIGKKKVKIPKAPKGS